MCNIYFLALLIGLAIALLPTLLLLRLSGVALLLTGVLVAVLAGVLVIDVEAFFLFSAGLADEIAEFTGSFSITGKYDIFLIGAQICSSTSRQISSEIDSSLLSSFSTTCPNSLVTATGTGTVFAAVF